MSETLNNSITTSTDTVENTSLCDYRALQACLAQHQGDRSKCMAEWEAFQQACAANKR
ncbi:hypothetical protein BDF22DRAFT_627861 [Syncephalis plumigaleata]|nr:hypothetical protein BDF22DRAFT_627861 [Syncephalis plumigaleata]